MSDFLTMIGFMALTFGLFLIPGLFSRGMERSDYLTLVAIPTVTFPVAILPGIIVSGFDKNSATYILGSLIVIGVATLNYRFQRRARRTSDASRAITTTTATGVVAKEG